MARDLGQALGCPRGDTDGDGVRISRTGTWDEELSEDVGDRGVQGRGVAELLAAVSRTLRGFSFSLFRSFLTFGRRIKGQRQETQGKEDVDMEDVLDGFQQKARDHARIPMQASFVVVPSASHRPYNWPCFLSTPHHAVHAISRVELGSHHVFSQLVVSLVFSFRRCALAP